MTPKQLETIDIIECFACNTEGLPLTIWEEREELGTRKLIQYWICEECRIYYSAQIEHEEELFESIKD